MRDPTRMTDPNWLTGRALRLLNVALRVIPRSLKHLTLLSIIGVLHLSVVWTLDRSTRHAEPSAGMPDSLVTVLIKPRISDTGGDSRGADLSKLIVRIPDPSAAVHIEPVELGFFVSRNNAATVAAPSLEGDGHRGIDPYVREAALAPGHGATVVLRIEVLDTGEPGRIEIDVSSGDVQVDRAAVDYARVQRWSAGRITGVPSTMWIRWAVRLQA